MAVPVVEIDDVDWTEVKRPRPNPHFFKVLVGDFTQRMKIPPNFVKNLQEDMTTKASSSSDTLITTASIEGPTGRTWYAELEKTTTGVFFTTGWSKFARDHSLKEHELLIIRYNGCLSFTVLIFDKTACEKEDQDGGSVYGGRKPQLKPRKLAFGQDELGDQLKEKSVSSSEPKITDSETQDEEEMNVVETSTRKQKKASERSKSGPVTEKEKLKAREAAHSFASENPFFVIRLKASHVDSRLEEKRKCRQTLHLHAPPTKIRNTGTTILGWSSESGIFDIAGGMHGGKSLVVCQGRFPIKFSRRYLPRSKTDVILRVSVNSKTWSVAYLPNISERNERDRLSRGWHSFVCDNSLEEDDYCAFELVKPAEFLIHIFRVSRVRIRAAFRARKNAKA